MTNPRREEAVARLRHAGCAVSAFGEIAAEFVDRLYGGMHHFPSDVKKPEWSSDCTVAWSHYGEMASFDAAELTRAVLLAHDLGVRFAVRGIGPGYLRVTLHKRDVPNTFSGSDPHPTMEARLANWRERNPAREAT